MGRLNETSSGCAEAGGNPCPVPAAAVPSYEEKGEKGEGGGRLLEVGCGLKGREGGREAGVGEGEGENGSKAEDGSGDGVGNPASCVSLSKPQSMLVLLRWGREGGAGGRGEVLGGEGEVGTETGGVGVAKSAAKKWSLRE